MALKPFPKIYAVVICKNILKLTSPGKVKKVKNKVKNIFNILRQPFFQITFKNFSPLYCKSHL